MKKTALITVAIALILSVTALAFASVNNPAATEGKAARTLENIHKGNQSIQQEFIWDEDAGVFKTSNIYTTGLTEDKEATVDDVFYNGAKGNGDIVGEAKNYTYWDGTKWVTKDDITRYEGADSRAEAYITRYDKTYWTVSSSVYSSVTGYQPIYSTSYSTSYRDQGEYGRRYPTVYTRVKKIGSKAMTGTFTKLTNVPGSYKPVVEITTAEGWNVTIESGYGEWGNQVKITSPSGQSSFVYGDPHMLQANGTQQQELAAVGNYVFNVGGYSLDLSCEKSRNGFSVVTDVKLTGPNDYEMNYGRNNEVKVTGGSN